MRTLSAITYGWTPLFTSTWLGHINHSPQQTQSFIFLVGFLYQVHPAHISSLAFYRINLHTFRGRQKVTQWFLLKRQKRVDKFFSAFFLFCQCNKKVFIFVADFVASGELWPFQLAETYYFRRLCFGWQLLTWCFYGWRVMLLSDCLYTHFSFRKLIFCMLDDFDWEKYLQHFW